ncbi:MAG: HemK family protein methyltransferase [Patescibacteria group bacterium]
MSNSDEPEAYAIGSIPFIHTQIYLDSHPLIPRTETEYWVNEVIKEINDKNILHPRILDLCAGSGCIGIAIMKELEDATVDFVEIEEKHHDTIRKNILENKLDNSKARIFGGSLFEKISDKYDFILSNPPYINPALKYRVEESVIDHEPEQALFGGKDGLEIIKEILSKAEFYLKPDGSLYIEHEPEQAEIISESPMYLNSFKDQFGVTRFSQFRKGR